MTIKFKVTKESAEAMLRQDATRKLGKAFPIQTLTFKVRLNKCNKENYWAKVILEKPSEAQKGNIGNIVFTICAMNGLKRVSEIIET